MLVFFSLLRYTILKLELLNRILPHVTTPFRERGSLQPRALEED